MFGLFKKHKPVKIRSCNDVKKYGVAAKDVKELLKKGCQLLKVSVVLAKSLFLFCELLWNGNSVEVETNSRQLRL